MTNSTVLDLVMDRMIIPIKLDFLFDINNIWSYSLDKHDYLQI